MYGCDLLFTPEMATKVRETITTALGQCPCEAGKRCPLLPADLAPLLQIKVPAPRLPL